MKRQFLLTGMALLASTSTLCWAPRARAELPDRLPPAQLLVRFNLTPIQGEHTETLLLSAHDPVHRQGGTIVNAEALRPGDRVEMTDGIVGTIEAVEPRYGAPLARNPSGARTVIGIAQRTVHETVALDTDKGSVETTPDHPFLTATGQFMAASKLRPGDVLLTASEGEKVEGRVRIRSLVQRKGEPRVVYNLLVDDYHTYAVGPGGLWVHNGGPCLPIPVTPPPARRFIPNKDARAVLPMRPLRDWPTYKKAPDLGAGARYPIPEERMVDLKDFGPRQNHDLPYYPAKSQSGLYPLKEGGEEHLYRVLFHPDRLTPLDLAAHRQLSEDYGVPVENWKLVRDGDRYGLAEEVQPIHGPLEEWPVVKVQKSEKSPTWADSNQPQTYESRLLIAREAVPKTIPLVNRQIYLGHVGWSVQVPHPKDPTRTVELWGQVEILGPPHYVPPAGKPVFRAVFEGPGAKEAMLESASRRHEWSPLTSYREHSIVATPREMQERAQAILRELRERAERPYMLHGSPKQLRGENCIDEAHCVLKLADPNGAAVLPHPMQPWAIAPNLFANALPPQQWGDEHLLPIVKEHLKNSH